MRLGKFVISCLVLSALSCGSAVSMESREGETRRDYPRFTFGIESSMAVDFLDYFHSNFISFEGDRIDVKGFVSKPHINGQFLVHGGVNLSGNLNLSLYTGVIGAGRGGRVYPLSLRLSWYSGTDPLRNRWIVFGSAGGGFGALKIPTRISAECRLGGGYRISLNRIAKLDFLVALQEIYTHPEVYEEDAGDYVPADRLRRNNIFCSALTFGIALTF